MAFIATLAALLLTMPPEGAVRWQCGLPLSRRSPAIDVSRSLDAEGRFLFDRITWRPDAVLSFTGVSWRLGPASTPSAPPRLRTEMVSTLLTLSRPARRPVWLVLRAGDREISRRLWFHQISDLASWQAQGPNILADFIADLPGVGPLPDLTDMRQIQIIAEEEGGAILASTWMSLPGRARLEQEAEATRPALDYYAAEYLTRCSESRLPSQAPPPR